MKFVNRYLAVAILLACGGGCASTASDDPSGASVAMAAASTQPAVAARHAECLVCKMNADLACVDVDVARGTPSYVYNGTTYYFCSTECRDKFAKEPQKYVKAK
jgi:Cu+-exporting ATPase